MSRHQYKRQLALNLIPPSSGRFENYYIANNTLSTSLLRETAELGRERQLGIWGASGLGKSHLLGAACHAASIVGRTASYFDLRAWLHHPYSCLEGLESVDVIALDGLDVLLEYEDWQYALFALINRARQRNCSIITASRSNPNALALLPDLTSRLLWGPVLRLRPLSESQLALALRQRALERGLTLPRSVVDYLLSHVARESGALFALLDKLDKTSLVAQRKLSIPFVKEVLASPG